MAKKLKTRLVGVNEYGLAVGEYHQSKPKLTDVEVNLIRDLYESGHFNMRELAAKFGVKKATIQGYVSYRRRAQHVSNWVRVCVRRRRR